MVLKKTNPELINLIHELKKASKDNKVKIWKAIASYLESSTRREVNLFKLGKYTKENETIIVPGKVLGSGSLNHKLTVAAFKFSQSAREKISNPITIQELLKNNPQGEKVRIIG